MGVTFLSKVSTKFSIEYDKYKGALLAVTRVGWFLRGVFEKVKRLMKTFESQGMILIQENDTKQLKTLRGQSRQNQNFC